jgi:PAS domain S-box-containing protein
MELEVLNDELVRAKNESEIVAKKFSDLYDSSPVGYFTISTAGEIIEINLTAAKMLEKDRTHLYNSRFDFFISDNTKITYHQFFNQLFANKTTENCVVNLSLNLDIQLIVQLTGIISENGEMAYVTAIDITQRKPLSGFNETLLSSLPYPAMYIRRKDRVVLAVNKIAADLGVKPGGHCWREFQKEENISDEEKKIASIYPDIVPSQYNIKCAFCRSDQCFQNAPEQNDPELHAFGLIWNTYWIKVSDDIYLHYAVNITKENQIEKINRSRLQLFDFAENHPLDELLEETLNQAETITGSLIGFFHFVEEDQKTLTLQNWSTRTKKDYCKAESKGMNYEIALAGVWVDCIHKRHAVIHNDYASLEHKKGLPPGHAAVIREMVVPVIRGSKIMAIVGVGNKPTDYNDKDLEVVTLFADLAWDIAERKRSEEALRVSRDYLDKIINTVASPIFVKNDSFQFMMVNDAVCALLGVSAEEIIGKTGYEHFPREQFDGYIAKDKEVFDTGKEIINEEFVTDAHGELRTLITTKTPYTDPAGRKFLVGVVSDITERKQAEETLKKSESHYRELANSFTNVFFELDKDLRYTFWNKASEELLGIRAEEALGKSMGNLFPENTEIQKVRGVYLDVIKNQEPQVFESTYEDGSQTIIFEIRVYPTLNGISVFTTDISTRKQAELEIKLKNDELQKINAEKDKFFSIIAHDLRGPFSGFMGLTDLLAEGCANMTSDEIQKIGELLRGSAFNLFGLLENLLTWSRMQRGIMPFEPVSQVLKSKIEEGMALVIESALKKEITIGYEIEDELVAFADSNMLLTLIRNLASNAVKFTPRGGNITISAKQCTSHLVEISVKDTGIGMDQFKIDNLFKLDINTSRKGTEGEISTGLGLILCKDFVEKHGGKLWVESAENEGSTFYFTLPAKE